MFTAIELRKQAATLRQKGLAITSKAAEEKRRLTVEERESLDKVTNDVADMLAEAEVLERSETQSRLLETTAGRMTDGNANERCDGSRNEPFKWENRGCSIEIDPTHADYGRCTPEYVSSFRSYLRDGSRALMAEKRGLQTAPNTQGGYLTSIQFNTSLIKFMDDLNFVRALSTKYMLGANVSMGTPSFDQDWADSDWTPEVPATAVSDDDTARFGKRELTPHQHMKKIKASRKMLRSGIIDVEAFLRQRIGYIFAKTEEKAFLTGDGAQKPLGVLTASANGISTARDVTAAGATAIAKNDFIKLKWSLKGQYHPNMSMIMHREGVKRLMQIDDGIGRPIFIDSVQTGERPQVLGMPLYMTEYAMSTFTTGQYVAVCGDFSYYWIADSLGLEIQVCDQTAAGTNQIEYYARAEVDGMPVLEEAFARLKLA